MNVGDVKTDGVDDAFTLRFGRTFSLYNAASYNLQISERLHSVCAGHRCRDQHVHRRLPGRRRCRPDLRQGTARRSQMAEQTVATLSAGPIEAQVIGDYVGKRFVTFSNDVRVPSFFLASLRLAARVSDGTLPLRKVEIALNLTNQPEGKGEFYLVDRLGHQQLFGLSDPAASMVPDAIRRILRAQSETRTSHMRSDCHPVSRRHYRSNWRMHGWLACQLRSGKWFAIKAVRDKSLTI